jgi:ABC-2 type transport system permease protein
MSLETDAMPAPSAAPAASRTRTFYWSVRRELWENRAAHLAPLVVSGLVLVGLFISTIGLPHRRVGVLAMAPARQTALVAEPYEFAAAAIVAMTFVVAAAYCLGALHGERRDRTILFWKSLPVSDLTTVLAKATVPFVILPVIAAAAVVAVQLIMFAWVSVMLLASGMNPLAPPVPLGPMTVVLLYGLVTQTLWYAPVYGWLLLVSGWTRRGAPFLWAFLPPLALSLVEKAAFNTTHLGSLLLSRLFGGDALAFVQPPPVPGKTAPHLPAYSLESLDPGRFLSSPGLWFGLVFAVACLAACVWQRRRQDPI